MKLKQKLLSTAFAVASLIGANSASAVIIGGVDFGPFNFHLETTTVAESLITGNGQTLTGYGQVNTVNGDPGYTGGADLLYFILTYTSQDFTPTSVGFSGGVINIYKGDLGNLLSTSSATNLANIAGLSQWVRLTGHGNLGGVNPTSQLDASGALTGASLSFTGAGLLDVDTSGAFGLAAVSAALNGNGLLDAVGGITDIAFTTSGNNSVLNNFDDTTGCKTGGASAGQFCFAGSADLRGPLAVPEPGSLALLGLGLLGVMGVGASKRRKS